VKHAALEVVAAKAGITFDMPQIIEAHGAEGTAAVCVRGTFAQRSVWSIGECNPKNNRNAYPWAMAEKRAVDRVILKLIGIHGLVYSEDEMTDAAEPAKTLVKDQREIWAAMRDELDACTSLDDLAGLWRSVPFKAEFARLNPSWQQQITEHKDARKDALSAVPARVAPNFENM
jgi:hypothetical protein